MLAGIAWECVEIEHVEHVVLDQKLHNQEKGKTVSMEEEEGLKSSWQER